MQKSKVGIEARDKVITGMNYVADAVKSTLGCFGLNCLIEKGLRITNDGFTVSREMCLTPKDEFERLGARVIHEVASKTNDKVGDATTTAVMLAQAIVQEAIKLLPQEGTFASKMKPAELIEQIKKEKDEVIEKLEKLAVPITTEKELIASAKVSVEDDELADLIGKAQFKLGKQGVILAEETAEPTCSIEEIKGIRIDNGLGTSVIMNNAEKQALIVDNCKVIMTNHTLKDLMPLKPILDQIGRQGKPNVVIIARAFTPECIQTCIENIQKGFNIFPINAPYTNQAEIMRDLEAVLGGRYIDQEEGKLEDIELKDIGFAKKIIARRYDAIFTGENNELTKVNVELRVEKLEKERKGEKSEFAKKNLDARISQLSNGFALLRVGAESDVERKRKKDKADDAVGAVRLAYSGGVVAGAGLAFKEIAETMPDTAILKKPLQSINEQIMYSAPEGFVIEPWVRDSYLVLKCALENACSVSAVFSTINCIVATENVKTGCQCNNNQDE